MAFDGRVFRVLIASPSDVEEEREIAVRVIQEWNDLNAYSRQVVLLPLRWETHSAPAYNVRPQEVINQAIVDECDLLVGAFWTRIGTPTGEAESGTLEEIERVASAGKPVMLYFSKVGIDPDQLDLEQVALLKEFKTKTYSNALVENYKSHIEFRDKLARQLELKVRELQKADDTGGPSVSLEFLDDQNNLVGSAKETTIEIPKLGDDKKLAALSPNQRQEYEEIVKSKIRQKVAFPINLAINNAGSSGVRNLYVELSTQSKSGDAKIYNPQHLLPKSLLFPSKSLLSGFWSKPIEKYVPNDNEMDIDNEGNATFSLEWGALQPQRAKKLGRTLFITATQDSILTINAKVFADSFPQPLILESTLKITTQSKKYPVRKYISDFDKIVSEVLGNEDEGLSLDTE